MKAENAKGNENNKSRRIGDLLTAGVFLLFVFGIGIMTIATKDREFSEMENRTLAQRPVLTLESVKKGEYTDKLETYLSDQVFLKDPFVSIKTDFDRLLGKSFQNGVYLTHDSDGSLRFLQQYTENPAQLDENVDYINEFAESVDIPVDFILVPNAQCALAEQLPSSALCDDQNKSFERVAQRLSDRVNFYPMNTEAAGLVGSESAYYRTDHHWTSLGAWNAVNAYLAASGQKNILPEYQSESIPDFYGTLYSKAPSAFTEPDPLWLYTNPNGEYTVTWLPEGRTADSIIDRSFFEKKDKYAGFLGGNFTRVDITSNTEGERVLIVKDSYANAAMQFFIDQYSRITMLDMRYYRMQLQTVAELCEEMQADRVILLYNMDFLNEDRNFVWLT